MTEDINERRRLIIGRRLVKLADQHGIPRLTMTRKRKLATLCAEVLGEDGIPDCDLRTLLKYTARGLLDKTEIIA